MNLTKVISQSSRSLSLALAVLSLVGCGEHAKPVFEINGPTMGTYYSVKLVDVPAGTSEATLRKGIEDTLATVIDLISTYEPGSELSRLNRNPSPDWIGVSAELLSLIEEGQRISVMSGGAFDITVGPLVNLWGFGPDPAADEVPSKEVIAQALR